MKVHLVSGQQIMYQRRQMYLKDANRFSLWPRVLVWWLSEKTDVLEVVCLNPIAAYWMDL